MSTHLYIKSMVCDRCKMAVAKVLEEQGIEYRAIELGDVTVEELLSNVKLTQLANALHELGFELIDDKKSKLIEQIKAEVIRSIHHTNQKVKKTFSLHLAEKVGKDYSSISALFSDLEGITLEQYIIHQKIEKVKELLVYNELSLGQIADQLNYSSIQHLSNQFKKVTGLTPSYFKKMRHPSRKPLDKV